VLAKNGARRRLFNEPWADASVDSRVAPAA
jgi:hypothetical protein